jgi:hypothetical protein
MSYQREDKDKDQDKRKKTNALDNKDNKRQKIKNMYITEIQNM